MKKFKTWRTKFKAEAGQTLVETVTALAIVIILVSSLVSMSVASIRSAVLSRNKNIASYLAYQELERVRNARDVTFAGSWGSFYNNFATTGLCSSQGSGCHLESFGSSFNFVAGQSVVTVTGTTFNLKIDGAQAGADRVSTNSTVIWNDSLGAHQEVVSTVYTSWR